MPTVMLASWPVHQRVAHIAERYSHFLLRDRHYYAEWFNATIEEVSCVIPIAIQAAEDGFPMMPSIWRAGQAQKNGERVENLKLPQGSHMRIEAALQASEVRSDFIREAVERELRRRERTTKPAAKPPDPP